MALKLVERKPNSDPELEFTELMAAPKPDRRTRRSDLLSVACISVVALLLMGFMWTEYHPLRLAWPWESPRWEWVLCATTIVAGFVLALCTGMMIVRDNNRRNPR